MEETARPPAIEVSPVQTKPKEAEEEAVALSPKEIELHSDAWSVQSPKAHSNSKLSVPSKPSMQSVQSQSMDLDKPLPPGTVQCCAFDASEQEEIYHTGKGHTDRHSMQCINTPFINILIVRYMVYALQDKPP
jgi:hypothetical protein